MSDHNWRGRLMVKLAREQQTRKRRCWRDFVRERPPQQAVLNAGNVIGDNVSVVSSFTQSEAGFIFGDSPRTQKSPKSLECPITSAAKTQAWLRAHELNRDRWSSPHKKERVARLLTFAERSIKQFPNKENFPPVSQTLSKLPTIKESEEVCVSDTKQQQSQTCSKTSKRQIDFSNCANILQENNQRVPEKNKLMTEKGNSPSSDDEPLSVIRHHLNEKSEEQGDGPSRKNARAKKLPQKNLEKKLSIIQTKSKCKSKEKSKNVRAKSKPTVKKSKNVREKSKPTEKKPQRKLKSQTIPTKKKLKPDVSQESSDDETLAVLRENLVVQNNKEPTVAISKKPCFEIPKEPAADIPKKPTVGIPKKPSVDIPKKPTVGIPKKPSVDITKKPTVDIPNKPAADIPKKPTAGSKNTGAIPKILKQQRTNSAAVLPNFQNAEAPEPFVFTLPTSTPKQKVKIPEKPASCSEDSNNNDIGKILDLSTSTALGVVDHSGFSDISSIQSEPDCLLDLSAPVKSKIPLGPSNSNKTHGNNSSSHNVSASSKTSTGRSLRPRMVSKPRDLCTFDSEEEEEEEIFALENDDLEWTVNDSETINNVQVNNIEDSVLSSDGSSEDEQVKVTLPKKVLGARWAKRLAPKPKNKPGQPSSPSETNNWKREEIIVPVQQPVAIQVPAEALREPHAYFQFFFDDDLLDSIVDYTNIYSTWKDGNERNMKVSKPELQQFLGVWMYMGVNQLPGLRDYWAADTLVNQVASVMSFNRFQKIRSHLHFFDKTQEQFLPAGDRFAKVRLILDHMKTKCNSLDQEQYYAIDETMIPYKGTFAGSLRQFVRNKPHRFGIKIFNLAGASGIVYDFLPYAGSETFRGIEFTPEEEAMGVGAKVVLSLAKAITDPANKSVFFDNYFASVKLVRHLKDEKKLLSTGTVRNNRIDHCPLTSDKELKALGRGAYDFKSQDGVQVTKWMDNKIVHLVSSLSGVQPEGHAQRYDKTTKSRIMVPIPNVIQQYNSKMGGVDLSDMLVEILRSPTRSRRWYLSVFGYMMDLAVVNAWLCYKRHATVTGKKIVYKTLKSFKLSVSHHLRHSGMLRHETGPAVSKPIKLPRFPRPNDEIRFDRHDHWPSYHFPQGRCKYCSHGKTTVICGKCNLHLCFVPTRQCFLKYHLPDLEN